MNTWMVKLGLMNMKRRVKLGLLDEQRVCDESLTANVAAAAVLGAQLDRFEPVDVVAVEEHEADDGALLVHLEGVAAEDDALDDDAVRIDRVDRAGGHQRLAVAVARLAEDEHRARREDDGREQRGHHHRFRPEEAFRLSPAQSKRVSTRPRSSNLPRRCHPLNTLCLLAAVCWLKTGAAA